MENGKKKVIMIYGADMNEDGTCGPETMTRIRTAVDHIESFKSPNDIVIILAAGYKSIEKLWRSLKVAMRIKIVNELGKREFRYAGPEQLSNGTKSIEFLIPDNNAWGTDPETRVALKALYILDPNIKDVTVVSSNYHLARIKMIWSFFPRYNVTAVGCNYVHPQQLLEPLKCVKDYVRCKWKGSWIV